MKQTDLVKQVAARSGLTQRQADAALKALALTVETTLRDGGEVSIVGFGTFKTAQRKARAAVNPSTKEVVQVPAKRVAVFRPGKALKEVVA
ncbi:MAG: HU family DNA-binding protein [Meiothermus sp.]|nr:HU family DNA-binding protein [Meiothermus sp.]